MGRKEKDVAPPESAPGGGAEKESADSLPKILRLARAGGSLQSQRVRCGKPGCKCARGQPHQGFYFFVRTPAGLRKFYVRRGDVPAVRAAIAARVRRLRMWRDGIVGARNLMRLMLAAAKRGEL